MPKNNSRKRKDERKVRAQIREQAMLYRECGHWHTSGGFIFCQNWSPIRRFPDTSGY